MIKVCSSDTMNNICGHLRIMWTNSPQFCAVTWTLIQLATIQPCQLAYITTLCVGITGTLTTLLLLFYPKAITVVLSSLEYRKSIPE